jgi:Ca2+-binding RTX toxin-like protein
MSFQRLKLSGRRAGLGLALAVCALAVVPAGAAANVPFKQISSPGPIESIWIGNDLSCQVKLKADDVYSFYPSNVAPGDCGVFVARGGTVTSPHWSAHDNSAVDNVLVPAYGTPFIAVSQSPVTGTGTAADPFKIVTTGGVAGGGLNITRTDTYVTGLDSWNIEITATDTGGGADNVILYHAGDCYLAESDFGYGAVNTAAGAAFCTSKPNNSPPGRTIGFGPSGTASSTGGTVIEGHFRNDVWSKTGPAALYPNVCFACTSLVDNGAGVSWSRTVPAGGSATVSLASTVKPPPTPCRGKTVTIAGGSSGDLLNGTKGADVIAALGGNDVVRGKGGKDTICGGAGNDVLGGGGGKDKIFGEAGKDLLKGGGGKDKLVGAGGKDRCVGGGGRDRAKGCEKRRGI